MLRSTTHITSTHDAHLYRFNHVLCHLVRSFPFLCAGGDTLTWLPSEPTCVAALYQGGSHNFEIAGFSESTCEKIPRYFETAGFSESTCAKILRYFETAGFSESTCAKIPRYFETAGFSESTCAKIPQYIETAGFSESTYAKIPQYIETAGFSESTRTKIPRYFEILGKDCLGVLEKETKNSFGEELACLEGSVRGLAQG